MKVRISTITKFLKLESTSSIVLFVTAAIAIVLCNSPLSESYEALWQTTVGNHVLQFWINEGLMTFFFLLIGLELKREFLQGELSHFSRIMLPGIAALGGMLVPALIYLLINGGHPNTLQGWAIPVATDIAFALGVLSFFGKRVPIGLKLFLMALAIFDDLGAIIIIAIYHTNNLSYWALGLGILVLLVLFLLTRFKVQSLAIYLGIGLVLWACTLKSGVHPTIAGILLAFLIPLGKTQKSSLLHRLEDKLHPWVAYIIMPLFAFANAGLSLQGITFHTFFHPVVLGVMLGLFLGKQLGVMSCSWLAIKLKWARLPEQTSWLAFYGAAILCGIGFTMSLFLGTLAFDGPELSPLMVDVRLGVLLGSLFSGIIGALFLQIAFRQKAKQY